MLYLNVGNVTFDFGMKWNGSNLEKYRNNFEMIWLMLFLEDENNANRSCCIISFQRSLGFLAIIESKSWIQLSYFHY